MTETAAEEKKAKGISRAAANAIGDAEKRGDVRAAKAIGKSFFALEAKTEQLKETRAAWKDRLNAAEASLAGAVKSDEAGTPGSGRNKLNMILLAFQDVEEVEAGKKSELHLLIEERNELRARLHKQLEGAKQLGLFD